MIHRSKAQQIKHWKLTLGLKYKIVSLISREARHQFQTRTLSACISSWRARSVHPFLTCMLSMLWRDLLKSGIFTLMLSVCSGYASIPDTYAQGTHQFLTRMLRVRISSWRVCSVNPVPVPDPAQRTHQFLARMLSVHIRSWHASPVQVSVPYVHAEDIQNEH